MTTYPTKEQADTMAAATPHPFFVYGTLRPGHGNARLWAGRATARYDGTAIAHNFSLSTVGFPYANPTQGARSVGALIVPHAAEYEFIRRQMDALEGVEFGHYSRITTAIETPEGWIVAWMYVPAHYGQRGRPVATDANGAYDFNLGEA